MIELTTGGWFPILRYDIFLYKGDLLHAHEMT